MEINKIIQSKLINNSEISRKIGISSPSIFTQKIKNVKGNKLTEQNLSDIKVVFENAAKEAELINLPKLIDMIRLFFNPDNEIQVEAIIAIINDYQNKYSDIGLMEWFEENKI